jgi:pimeloyl-ACP methyl ester carboxylesterase
MSPPDMPAPAGALARLGPAHHFTAPRRHHQVPDAGHNLPQEAPGAFADAVLELATL